MAEIVLGFGTSHGPQLNLKPEQWKLLYDKDTTDSRIDYKGLLAKADPRLQEEATLERWTEQFDACHEAMAVLREKLLQAAPDAMVVIGDDQHEQFLADNMPMFSIYYGKTVNFDRSGEKERAGWQQVEREGLPPGSKEFPAQADLALHLIQSLKDQNFDIASSNQLRSTVGLGHAFAFLYRHILPEGTIPIVPVAVNTFFPPNQPTPSRSYDFGQALRRAIESWDSTKRVAVVCSGGLSHTVIDEDYDRALMKAIENKNEDDLRSFSTSWVAPGTSEILNWIALAGAMEPMNMTTVDFQECYRTPAGTGCCMAFAYWE